MGPHKEQHIFNILSTNNESIHLKSELPSVAGRTEAFTTNIHCIKCYQTLE